MPLSRHYLVELRGIEPLASSMPFSRRVFIIVRQNPHMYAELRFYI
jgi:hypothetical protein